MTIWRGAGGGGDATTDSEINLITSLSNSIIADTATTTAAAASATASELAAQASEDAAAISETNAAASAAAALVSEGAASVSAAAALVSENNAAASALSVNDTNLVHIAGTETITGTKTFSNTIVGSVNGNAATATTSSACSGNAATVTNGVYTSTDQTIGGNKTFSNTILGSISGATGTFSGDVQMASQNGGQLAGLRNKVTNGDMTVCQRATSTAGITGSTQAFLVDRFRTGGQSTAGVVRTSQTQDMPSGLYGFSAKINVTTADTSIASSDVFAVVQPIEGVNIRDLFGKTFTLSFWVRSSKTGIHCVAFTNAGPDRSYVVEYSISVANTWEYKTITVSGGLTTAGAWDLATGTGISLRFTLMAGSSFHTTAGAWNTGNFFATSNQVNCLDTIGNIFGITYVQLEVGPVATPFEQRPYGMELALCQRYYQRNPIATGAFGTTPSAYLDGRAYNTSTVSASVAITRYLPVVMRVNPTVTFYYDIQDGSTIGPSSPVSSNQGMFFFNAAVPTGNWIDLDDWQAVAEL